jgi:G:T-mismatch repair DNA endonuclease (very short patch repair protein)
MTTPNRAQQNREKAARYRMRMREAGYREIIVWATPEQATIIKELVKGNLIKENGDDSINI